MGFLTTIVGKKQKAFPCSSRKAFFHLESTQKSCTQPDEKPISEPNFFGHLPPRESQLYRHRKRDSPPRSTDALQSPPSLIKSASLGTSCPLQMRRIDIGTGSAKKSSLNEHSIPILVVDIVSWASSSPCKFPG